MIHLSLFLLFFSVSVFAGKLRPEPPVGWIEMKSIEPVEVTWVKAMPQKALDEVPALMVQVFPRTEKINQLIQKERPDASGCFVIHDEEWTQTWCAKPREAFVLLVRGKDHELALPKDILLAWVKGHD